MSWYLANSKRVDPGQPQKEEHESKVYPHHSLGAATMTQGEGCGGVGEELLQAELMSSLLNLLDWK